MIQFSIAELKPGSHLNNLITLIIMYVLNTHNTSWKKFILKPHLFYFWEKVNILCMWLNSRAIW
uniref:Uncharacterized protein n=1 Tax=Anguilla anguilla TaxID=7936 RepID=A0A0E9VNV2_ANGAN